MTTARYIGLGVLALVWLWLCAMLVSAGGGWTLKNILVMAMSGIIIFLPLYKKYMRADQNPKDR